MAWKIAKIPLGISLICVAAILLFSYSRKDKGEHNDDICEDIKGIEVENIEDIKYCLKICDGDKYRDSVVCVDEDPICLNGSLLLCSIQITNLKNYSCKDGTDSCAISKRKQKSLESLREIVSESRKLLLEYKLQCEVFGCDAPKDSSFFMFTEDDIISSYNRKYLLMSSYISSGLFSNKKEEFFIFKIPLPNNDSASLSDILSDCIVRKIYDLNTLFLKDSKCYLDSLIT